MSETLRPPPSRQAVLNRRRVMRVSIMSPSLAFLAPRVRRIP
jgi:hypothetical protein